MAHVVYRMVSVKVDVWYVERSLSHSSVVWEALQGGLDVSVLLRLFASSHLAQSGVPGMCLCAAFYCLFACFCVFLRGRWVLLLRVLSPCGLRAGCRRQEQSKRPVRAHHGNNEVHEGAYRFLVGALCCLLPCAVCCHRRASRALSQYNSGTYSSISSSRWYW